MLLRKYGSLILLALSLSACQPSPTFLNPVSSISTDEANLFKVILGMALVVFVLVEGALIWILIRDRRKAADDTPPPQIYGNTRLEIVWTAIPIFLVISLFIMTVRTSNAVAAPSKTGNDLNVTIIGHQWWWEFDYPDLGFDTANELHVPAGTNVHISLESFDVIHSFWVPQLSGKTDIIPGQSNTMWLRGDRPGVYIGQCSEFCGAEHALMRMSVFVDSQGDFDAWVANQQTAAYQPQTDAEKAGLATIEDVCASCHTVDPSESRKKGPNLTHLFSRTTFAGGTFDLNEENVRRWLKDTQAMKPENDMEITLTSKEIDNLIAYLTHLK